MHHLTARIPKELNDRLGYAAIDHKMTKQEIIAKALEAWLDKAEKTKVKSHDKK